MKLGAMSIVVVLLTASFAHAQYPQVPPDIKEREGQRQAEADRRDRRASPPAGGRR